ncbi:MAG: LysR family transcriptional regulator [Clostridia bacterium]|nr:LysR family transcriptional regulator [Clostridia bacterium]
MNTLHFKYAVEVEKTGSITQAAENLFMGQPNLSKAIIELEDTLGFMIFERTSKGVIPTVKGIRFLAYAKNILTQIEKMESLADESISQSLSFAFSRSAYIAKAVSKFALSFDYSSKIHMNIRESSSVALINSVAAGAFNFGAIRYKTAYEKYFLDYISDKELDLIPFWEFDAMITIPKSYGAIVENIDGKKLASMTFLVYGDETIPYLSPGEIRKDTKFPISVQCVSVYDRATANELLTVLPNAYMITEPIPCGELEKYGLLQKKCDIPGERFKDVLIFPKGYQFSNSDKKFFDILTQIKNEMEFDLR